MALTLNIQVGGLKQLLDAPSEDEDDEEQDPRYSLSPSISPFPDTLFIFGSKTNATDLRSMHPPPAGIEFLCATYFQNADPIMKILHRPTIQVAIFAAADNLTAGPPEPALEALMFSMYFVAVTSLTPEQCFASLGHDKDKLLAQFKYGSETALANAHFLTSTELKCLQAFVIYVVSNPPMNSTTSIKQFTMVTPGFDRLTVHRCAFEFTMRIVLHGH